MYRLLALDMDGTLLNRNKVVTPVVQQTLQSLIRKGVNVTIASGRFPASVWLHGQHIGMTCPLIAFNGAVILDANTGELTHGYPIVPAAAQRIAELAEQAGIYVHFYSYHQLFVREINAMNVRWPLANVVIDPRKPLAYAHYKEQADRIQVRAVGNLHHFVQTNEVPIYKATMISENPQLLDELYKELESWQELTLTKTGQRRFDMNAAGVSKKSALDVVSRTLGVAPSEAVAIGDYDNDIDMLQWAALGIAMENGSKSAKQAANVITASNEEDGVAEAVNRYFLSC
ncbi:Cof-type HAD-IIB family hydrolase [Paenibacillus taiwanensis]|uniref:Cof-type HAD-IIB family hydrolase n=1 Tax=Paenibacillus taiwanensis TaxID=401638 RepID=UPI00041D9B54|nr:Cof-type HAD-IIB family hydrolase [Paenibacillus taiwanensis]